MNEVFETLAGIFEELRSESEDREYYELVKSRFLKLNSSHVEYVMGCMRETVTKITNIMAYLIMALYNAPSIMSHNYQPA